MLQVEKQRRLAEDEAMYLRTLIASLNVSKDLVPEKKQILLNTERSRIIELETHRKSLEEENSKLTLQIEYWTKMAKKNQEARLKAEAIKETLESQVNETAEAKSTTESPSQLETLQKELKAKESKLNSTESILKSTQVCF